MFLCNLTNSLSEITAFRVELPRIFTDFVILPCKFTMSMRENIKAHETFQTRLRK
jgi:hypothetical protein